MNIQNALYFCAPRALQFHEPIRAAMALHAIDTVNRVACFLAQCAHESAGFTVLRENMNYSADALARVWPGRYRGPDGKPNELALSLHRKPEAIANHTYANRMGNGPPVSGDGWRTRGVGIIQLTGTYNLTVYSRLLFGDDKLLYWPEIGTEPDNASQLACLFWNANDLNEYADDLDIDAISDQINIGRQTEKHGDAIGFAHREKLTRQLLEILA